MEPMTTPIEGMTPRPWRVRGGPQEGADYVLGPDKDDFLTGPLRQANAALIVAAVNDYDRLRAIEDAARAFFAVYDQDAVYAANLAPVERALREALR